MNNSFLVKSIGRLEYKNIILLCLTLGLAPFTPPHFYQKLVMLFHGELVKAIDIFDFLFHGLPWFVLIAKVVITVKSKKINK